MDSCFWRKRSKWHGLYRNSMTCKCTRFACIDGKADSQHCPDQALCACSTTSSSAFNFFMFSIIHSTESTPSNKNAVLAQAKHWMPEGLKLLSHCCGGSGESQKQTEESWPQLLPTLHLLCLQTERLFIFTGLWTNCTVRQTSVFPHFKPFDWCCDLASQYMLVTHICQMFYWMCVTALSFPAPFLAWHPLRLLLGHKTSQKKPKQAYFVNLAGLETSRTLAMVSHCCNCHCYGKQRNFGLHPLPMI